MLVVVVRTRLIRAESKYLFFCRTVGLAGVEVQQLELFSSLLQSPCCLSPGRDGTRDGRQPARTRTKISYLYSHYNHYQIYKEIQTPTENLSS